MDNISILGIKWAWLWGGCVGLLYFVGTWVFDYVHSGFGSDRDGYGIIVLNYNLGPLLMAQDFVPSFLQNNDTATFVILVGTDFLIGAIPAAFASWLIIALMKAGERSGH